MNDTPRPTALILEQALAYHQAGRLQEAERGYRQLLAAHPEHPEGTHLLGLVAYQTGRLALAAEWIGKAIALNGAVAAYHINLGAVLMELGAVDAAVAQYERALSIDPGHALALSNLGNALGALGRVDEAMARHEQALRIKPDFPEALNNLGSLLKDCGRFAEAQLRYEQAFAVKPDYAETLSNLGAALKAQGRLAAAAQRYEQALALKPGFAEALYNLGNVRKEQGRMAEAAQRYEQALTLKPDYAEAHCNLIMGMHYAAANTSADILACARRFAACCAGQARGRAPAPLPRRDAHRRLRIGYVSADFAEHPVGYFLAGVLPAHDRSQVEVLCYSNRVLEDAMSARLRRGADHWRSIAGVTDAVAAGMIEQDGIDILVDLSGHTAGNRLLLFARRPAPVQVTWLGYFGTTGLAAIDYILADGFVVAEGEEAYFSEKVWRLPGCYLCYTAHALDIAVAPPPMLRRGHVTLGCFNNRAKLGRETLELWVRILDRLPTAHLFLKTKALADAEARQELLGFFADRGIAARRLELEGFGPLPEALAAYGRMDIALDPFPFGGCTTSAEALWMGVPLVTLRGARWTGRMSESILAAIGRQEWVAADGYAYVDRVVALAEDPSSLVAWRGSLRATLEGSAFCDGKRFTQGLEAAYRGIWQACCDAASR